MGQRLAPDRDPDLYERVNYSAIKTGVCPLSYVPCLMIVDYIRQFEKANKQQLRVLIADKLPDNMLDPQKDRKILSFLMKLKKTEF